MCVKKYFSRKRMESMLRNYISIRENCIYYTRLSQWWSKKPITSPKYVEAGLTYGEGTLKACYCIYHKSCKLLSSQKYELR